MLFDLNIVTKSVSAVLCPTNTHRPNNYITPPGASAEELKQYTLTNLYNKRPTWLDNAHKKLDKAVFAAYGWPDDLTDEEILEKLLRLNQERHSAEIV